MELHIVLLEPEIPQNTGNIARTCVAAGARLHLIKPLGFSLDEKHVRRAGLDYWDDLDLQVYENAADFFAKTSGPWYFSTTKAEKHIGQIRFPDYAFLVFGKESAGLPEDLLLKHRQTCFRIPMKADTRSLNLSNAAAVAAYEVLRQHNYEELECRGNLHRHTWS